MKSILIAILRGIVPRIRSFIITIGLPYLILYFGSFVSCNLLFLSFLSFGISSSRPNLVLVIVSILWWGILLYLLLFTVRNTIQRLRERNLRGKTSPALSIISRTNDSNNSSSLSNFGCGVLRTPNGILVLLLSIVIPLLYLMVTILVFVLYGNFTDWILSVSTIIDRTDNTSSTFSTYQRYSVGIYYMLTLSVCLPPLLRVGIARVGDKARSSSSSSLASSIVSLPVANSRSTPSILEFYETFGTRILQYSGGDEDDDYPFVSSNPRHLGTSSFATPTTPSTLYFRIFRSPWYILMYCLLLSYVLFHGRVGIYGTTCNPSPFPPSPIYFTYLTEFYVRILPLFNVLVMFGFGIIDTVGRIYRAKSGYGSVTKHGSMDHQE